MGTILAVCTRLSQTELNARPAEISPDVLTSQTTEAPAAANIQAEKHALQAVANAVAGKFEHAIRDCDKAIELDSDYARAYCILGLASKMTGLNPGTSPACGLRRGFSACAAVR